MTLSELSVEPYRISLTDGEFIDWTTDYQLLKI
jgi:hypothetical protein